MPNPPAPGTPTPEGPPAHSGRRVGVGLALGGLAVAGTLGVIYALSRKAQGTAALSLNDRGAVTFPSSQNSTLDDGPDVSFGSSEPALGSADAGQAPSGSAPPPGSGAPSGGAPANGPAGSPEPSGPGPGASPLGQIGVDLNRGNTDLLTQKKTPRGEGRREPRQEEPTNERAGGNDAPANDEPPSARTRMGTNGEDAQAPRTSRLEDPQAPRAEPRAPRAITGEARAAALDERFAGVDRPGISGHVTSPSTSVKPPEAQVVPEKPGLLQRLKTDPFGLEGEPAFSDLSAVGKAGRVANVGGQVLYGGGVALATVGASVDAAKAIPDASLSTAQKQEVVGSGAHGITEAITGGFAGFKPTQGGGRVDVGIPTILQGDLVRVSAGTGGIKVEATPPPVSQFNAGVAALRNSSAGGVTGAAQKAAGIALTPAAGVLGAAQSFFGGLFGAKQVSPPPPPPQPQTKVDRLDALFARGL